MTTGFGSLVLRFLPFTVGLLTTNIVVVMPIFVMTYIFIVCCCVILILIHLIHRTVSCFLLVPFFCLVHIQPPCFACYCLSRIVFVLNLAVVIFFRSASFSDLKVSISDCSFLKVTSIPLLTPGLSLPGLFLQFVSRRLSS